MVSSRRVKLGLGDTANDPVQSIRTPRLTGKEVDVVCYSIVYTVLSTTVLKGNVTQRSGLLHDVLVKKESESNT